MKLIDAQGKVCGPIYRGQHGTMNGANRLLVTDEQVEFEK